MEGSNNWFHFLLALVVLAFTGVGTLMVFLNSQLWKKLDRMTNLFMAEGTKIEAQMTEIRKTATCQLERIVALEVRQEKKQ